MIVKSHSVNPDVKPPSVAETEMIEDGTLCAKCKVYIDSDLGWGARRLCDRCRPQQPKH